MKKALVILLTFILCVATAIVVAVWQAGRRGSSSIEGWIASQLQLIAGSYLNPQLSFEDLDYEYPGTVRLARLRLTADDPRSPEGRIDILGCDEATITLAEIPRVGWPIVIERVSLKGAEVSAVAVEPGSPRFAGFSDLLRVEPTEAIASATAPHTPPVSQPRNAEPPRLSDYFRIKLIELADARFLYDPRIDGTDPMRLDRINTRLDVTSSQAGVYDLNFKIARHPVLDLVAKGKLNLDRFHASDLSLMLLGDLSDGKIDYLPPQLQKTLREYDARGRLEITLGGELPIMRPLDGSLDLSMRLTDANARFGRYRAPVEHLTLAADLHDRAIHLTTFKLQALKGDADLTGSLQLDEARNASVKLAISNMLLHELRSRKDGEEVSKLVGRISAQAEAQAPLKVVMARLNDSSGGLADSWARQPLPENWGQGFCDLSDADLVFLPVIAQINESMRAVGGLVGGSTEPRDQLKVTFKLSEDRAIIEDAQLTSKVVAARGKGSMWLDGRIDLVVNGGPIEKMQSLLGPIGQAIGSVTDQIVAYRITGTQKEPKVAVEVGGGAVGAVKSVGESAVKGVEKVGEGVGKIIGIGK